MWKWILMVSLLLNSTIIKMMMMMMINDCPFVVVVVVVVFFLLFLLYIDYHVSIIRISSFRFDDDDDYYFDVSFINEFSNKREIDTIFIWKISQCFPGFLFNDDVMMAICKQLSLGYFHNFSVIFVFNFVDNNLPPSLTHTG